MATGWAQQNRKLAQRVSNQSGVSRGESQGVSNYEQEAAGQLEESVSKSRPKFEV